MKEKCWSINETYPIPIKRNGLYLTTSAMRYETAIKINNSTPPVLDAKTDAYVRRMYAGDSKYLNRMNLANDVTLVEYDYEKGEATFKGSSTENIQRWFDLHQELVTSENNHHTSPQQ